MGGGRAGLASIVSSTYAVLGAAQDLQDDLADEARRAAAVARLGALAEARLDGMDDFAAQGFEATGAPLPTQRNEATEDLLSAALAQVSISQTLLAAGRAVGEGDEPAAPEVLGAAVANLDQTAAELRRQRDAAESAEQGFAAKPTTSADTKSAVKVLKERVEQTLDLVNRRCARVAGDAVKGLGGFAPARFQELWGQIGERLQLDKIGWRLTRLGLRALEAALDILARLVPLRFLDTMRDEVNRLWENLDGAEPSLAATAWALGVDGVRTDAGKLLSADSLDRARLDRATDSLGDLGAQFGRLMNIAGGIAASIGAVTTMLGVFHLGVAAPQLAVAAGSAYVVLIAATVLLGRDYLDSGSGLGLVRGVRATLLDATA